ncbi:hypothetical protein RSOLAG22IIIB_11951 [Rhizoctonia solani]|uniref:Uncharacterized protein n=1 Tax=Rhizoctonia solani TaxID=456999 RepID=A0A0K6GB74_9AGAM|nr:hypothetical protein RSOLAG22IIIB_11951 [Rhizoctonia solani]
MARDVKSPYPDDAVFGVHKGFKTGVFTEYRDFLAQTSDYPGGKELWAVFTEPEHAREYVSTGRCPVRPLAQHPTTEVNPVPDGSARSLPTPDASPETDVQPPSLPTRQRPSASVPMMASASQPQPTAARRQQPTKPDPDSGDETEPEEEFKPPSATLPAAATKTPKNPVPLRPFISITRALVRDLSGNGEKPKTPPIENAAPAASQPVASSTTTLTAVPGPSRRTQHVPPTASAPGRKTVPVAPVPTPAPSIPTATPAPIPVPTPIPNPALFPELPRQPRPHGTYEQCHHCNGTGWNITPAQPTNAIPSSQTSALQTPSRPRPAPTTGLRIFQAVSDSDRTAGPSTNKTRTPSGGRLRVASVGGGIGPERTPKRDPKRVVSDSMTGRRARVVSDGAKDKGKGKGKARAVEVSLAHVTTSHHDFLTIYSSINLQPMDLDVTSPEAGPPAYDYM